MDFWIIEHWLRSALSRSEFSERFIIFLEQGVNHPGNLVSQATNDFALARATLLAFLLLCSLKAIRKEATIVARIFGRSTPDPRIGSPVELSGSDASGLLNLVGKGLALPG